jgi:hypothetical protein
MIKINNKMLEIINDMLKNTLNLLTDNSLIHSENKLISGLFERREIAEIIVEKIAIKTAKKAKMLPCIF